MGKRLVVGVVSEEELADMGERLVIALDRGALWSPPAEALLHDPEQGQEEQGERVRRSLEAFLNDRLEALRWAVRTGRWVLGQVHVQVEPVPEAELEAEATRIREALQRWGEDPE